MKIVKIWADVHSTGLFNELGAFYLKEQTTIHDQTWVELLAWVENYDFIAISDEEVRENNLEKIMNLDTKGIELMQKIKSEWNKDIETKEELVFSYYSEGLMKILV